jgi:hypothetical protein
VRPRPGDAETRPAEDVAGFIDVAVDVAVLGVSIGVLTPLQILFCTRAWAFIRV